MARSTTTTTSAPQAHLEHLQRTRRDRQAARVRDEQALARARADLQHHEEALATFHRVDPMPVAGSIAWEDRHYVHTCAVGTARNTVMRIEAALVEHDRAIADMDRQLSAPAEVERLAAAIRASLTQRGKVQEHHGRAVQVRDSSTAEHELAATEVEQALRAHGQAVVQARIDGKAPPAAGDAVASAQARAAEAQATQIAAADLAAADETQLAEIDATLTTLRQDLAAAQLAQAKLRFDAAMATTMDAITGYIAARRLSGTSFADRIDWPMPDRAAVDAALTALQREADPLRPAAPALDAAPAAEAA